jgi:hypothetical protein
MNIGNRYDIPKSQIGLKAEKNEEIHILKSFVHSGGMEASHFFEVHQKSLNNYKLFQFSPLTGDLNPDAAKSLDPNYHGWFYKPLLFPQANPAALGLRADQRGFREGSQEDKINYCFLLST